MTPPPFGTFPKIHLILLTWPVPKGGTANVRSFSTFLIWMDSHYHHCSQNNETMNNVISSSGPSHIVGHLFQQCEIWEKELNIVDPVGPCPEKRRHRVLMLLGTYELVPRHLCQLGGDFLATSRCPSLSLHSHCIPVESQQLLSWKISFLLFLCLDEDNII